MTELLGHTRDALPTVEFLADQLARQLGSTSNATAISSIQANLLDPIKDIVGRPSKGIRAKLVEIGYQCFSSVQTPEDTLRLKHVGAAIEFLHAGSLIIDDIQDESDVRRNDVTLHKRFGAARAICAGNWLYFWPLRMLSNLQLSTEQENLAFRIYNETLERGHYGQAIDVSTRIEALNQENISELCWAALSLKTGVLTSLAMKLGALIANATREDIEWIGNLGNQFGVALQCFDDIGNLLGRVDTEKQYEDLLKGKPSFVWAFVADHCGEAEFRTFREAIAELPNDKTLKLWLDDTDALQLARAKANEKLNQVLLEANKLEKPEGVERLRDLADILKHAYG